MLKKLVVALTVLALLVPFAACKKKEEPKMEQPGGPGVFVPPTEPQVVVPENVKGKWTSVDLVVQNKAENKSSEVTVGIGETKELPGSNLRVEVVEFLPDFKMEGTVITSASNEPNNPAARVKIFEGDKEIFKGWLYSNFPAIHPFQHEKLAITLKEGNKKA